jgi:hypothetical protein
MSERASMLTSGAHRTARESMCTQRSLAPTNRPHWQQERERERERGRGLAPTGGVHLSGVAGVGGGPTGLVWTEKRFSIFLEFLMSFLFYFP